MRKNANWIVLQGPAQFVVALAGWLQSVDCIYLHWVAVTAWVQCASMFVVTLVIGVSTLGIGASTLGRCIACCATWVAQTLLRLALAFAALFFAIVILVNSLLAFCNASADLFSVGIFPWSTIVSCCAAATTWDSGEAVGIVMYWCLRIPCH
jgi:hypothetical protein